MKNYKSGFTLIELMVVIVIIGVLASLAIPRFTEASAKARMAEAPRILTAFETAYLAAHAEQGSEIESVEDLILALPGGIGGEDSRWFNYAAEVDPTVTKCRATAKNKIGAFPDGGTLTTTHVPVSDNFIHSSSNLDVANRMLPNFGATVEDTN